MSSSLSLGRVPRSKSHAVVSAATVHVLAAVIGIASCDAQARDDKRGPGMPHRAPDDRSIRANETTPYAPAPFAPEAAHKGAAQAGGGLIAPSTNGDGRMSPEERQRLRREIHDAGKDIYKVKR